MSSSKILAFAADEVLWGDGALVEDHLIREIGAVYLIRFRFRLKMISAIISFLRLAVAFPISLQKLPEPPREPSLEYLL